MDKERQDFDGLSVGGKRLSVLFADRETRGILTLFASNPI